MRGKVLLLLTVCMAVVVGAELPGSSAEDERNRGATPQERTASSEIGASISHREGLVVDRDEYTYDDTYGYTLWNRNTAAALDHGGTPVVRVAVAYDLKPEEIDRAVTERIDEFPDLPTKRETVRVGREGHKGVAISTVPGSTPSVEVYVPVDGKVYRINLYREKLDEEGKRLLTGVKFAPPDKSVSSLERLPAADDPEAFRASASVEREAQSAERRQKDAEAPPTRSTRLAPSQVPVYPERQISEGCWRAASRFFVQTQHGYGANRLADDPYRFDIPTGFTAVGMPNYWGQYTHGNLGYGRCVSTYYTNDKYAVDYPLNRGDVVFSPFRSGTVTFAGRNTSHANYGIFVVIRDANGAYFSMSAHLSKLASGIYPGANVSASKIIGYAGNTGDPSIPVGYPHLHQAFYRYPGLLGDGSPYGGQGLQVVYHRYTGTAAGTGPGVYQFGTSRSSTQVAKNSRISN